jgi:hypothetical protein
VNRLEERYRRVLRVLPAPYRVRWEEEMVEAYLASVETDDPDRAEFLAEFGRPRWAEVASVVALSVRLRLGLAGSPSAGSRAWGDAVRFVALVWVLVGAATAATVALEPLWTVLLTHWGVAAPDPYAVAELAPGTMGGLADTVWRFAPLAWIIAFAALLLGRIRAARIVAAVLVARQVVWLLVSAVDSVVVGRPTYWEYALPTVLVDVGLLVTLWAVRPGDRPRPRPWLLAFVVGVVGLGLLALTTQAVVVRAAAAADPGASHLDAVLWAVSDRGNLYVFVVVVAAALQMARGAGRDPARSLRWAVLVGVVLVQRLVTVPVWGGASPGLVAVAVEVLALVAVMVSLAGSAAGLRSWDDGAAAARTP